MRIAWVADVHLANHKIYGGPVVAGLNARCRMVLDSLRAAYDIAAKALCKALIVNGDLFDTAKPSPQLIAAVQEVIKGGGLPTFIMLGNHDMESAADGDHALGPLAPVATLITKPTKLCISTGGIDEVEVWAVPFQPGKAEEWLPTVLAEVEGQPRVCSSASTPKLLALHLGLRDLGKTPPWLMDAHDSVSIEQLAELCVQHGISCVTAGNWHDPRRWTLKGVELVQIGSMCPTGFDDLGHAGTLAVVEI
jgi:hypothetical protein